MTPNRRFRITTAAGLVLAVTTLAALAENDSAGNSGTVEGYWEGTVSLPAGQLPVQIDLMPEDEQGVWTGKIDIPAQGIHRLTLDGVTVQERAVMFKLPGLPGDPVFNGSLNSNGSTIVGNYVHGKQVFPFTLERKPAPDTREDLEALYAEFQAPGTPGEGIVGRWRALLEAGPAKLRLVLNVTRAEDGTLSASMDSVDQGHTGMPISLIEFNPEDRSLLFQMRGVGAQYRGTLSEDGSRLSGLWQQGAALPLDWNRAG